VLLCVSISSPVLIWTLGEMLALPMTNVLAADRAALKT